jgi:hypothetical protein
MQLPVGAEVVVCRVVVGGGGGGGAACVVVVRAACVVVVGGGAACVAVVGAAGAVGTAVAAALCVAGLACGCCFLALCCFGLALVVVVVGVDWVVEAVVGAATLWLEVDEAAPQALTSNVSRTAPSAMCRYLMVVSLAPRRVVACLKGRRTPWVASRI